MTFTALYSGPEGLAGYYDNAKLEAYKYTAMLQYQGHVTRMTAMDDEGRERYIVSAPGIATMVFVQN